MRRAPDGRIVAVDAAGAYPVWSAYHSVFDEVIVLARVSGGPARPATTRHRAPPGADRWEPEGPGVAVYPLPDVGVHRSMAAPPRLCRAVAAALSALGSARPGWGPVQPGGGDRYLARLPGVVGDALIQVLSGAGAGYGVEVLGDPRPPLGGLAGRWARAPARRRLARHAAGAGAVSYVTRRTLQERYPAAPGVITTSYAPGLEAADFVAFPRPRGAVPTPARLLVWTSRDAGHRERAVLSCATTLTTAALATAGVRLEVTVAGPAADHGPVGGRSLGAGGWPGPAIIPAPRLGRAGVRAALDRADVFVHLPAATALPRAVLVAMARGVPTVAAAAGGLTELLAPADLVRPGDAAALAGCLAAVVTDPARLAAMSARNRRLAAGYRACDARERAAAFYAEFAARTGGRRRAIGARR